MLSLSEVDYYKNKSTLFIVQIQETWAKLQVFLRHVNRSEKKESNGAQEK